jgi:hypothetical protein
MDLGQTKMGKILFACIEGKWPPVQWDWERKN